jgi:hypothetical protein
MHYEKIALAAPVVIETWLACMTFFVRSLTGKTCYFQKRRFLNQWFNI